MKSAEKRKTLYINFHKDNIKIPIFLLLRSALIFSAAAFLILIIFTLNGGIELFVAISFAVAVFAISVIFVTPYIRNIVALTNYVERLALDKTTAAPDLYFLNNIKELSVAIKHLHWSWENKQNQLEALLSEGKVLIDSLPDALVMLDEYCNILRINKVAASIFGDDANYNISKLLSDLQIKTIIEKTLDDGLGRKLEISPSEYTQHDFILSVERMPVYATSGIALIIAMHDISELKLTEKRFADFVANASHEIRTPLTSVLGYTETLLGGAKDDPATLNSFLKIISENAIRMNSLVKDLLSLSELERTMHTPPSEKVNIRDLLESVKSHGEARAKQKNIRIKSFYGENIPIITGDESQLRQVFENLLNNSIKYGNENSEVNIEVRRQVNDENLRRHNNSNAAEMLCISFVDESEGIAPEHLPRLTERFYRVDKARSRQLGGTGLGLAIVSHILARHQGGIIIESELGNGSRFTVIFPVR